MNWLIFCTRNAEQTLPSMISSLESMDLSQGDWNAVVVDNGSTDSTLDILAQAQTALPITVLSNSQSSKNSGLNLALDWLGSRCTDAELIAFSDDDIIADRNWLSELLTVARHHADADLFGGAIDPLWPAPIPKWLASLSSNFDVLYARTHQISGYCPAHYLYGPNMAVRAHLFAQGLRFDTRIGPLDSINYRMGSETEFLERAERLGHRACFAPDARVQHQVRPNQMRAEFVFSRARRHGLGKGEFARRQKQGIGNLPPPRMMVRLLFSELKLLLTWLPGLRFKHSKVRYGREWLRGYARGYFEAVAFENHQRPVI